MIRMFVWLSKWTSHFCVVLTLTQMALMKRLVSLIRVCSSFLSRRILITLLRFKLTYGATDKMNEYITHIGSGLFTCFGGVEKGGYIGQKLLEG